MSTVHETRRASLGAQLPDQSALFLFSGEPKQQTLDMDYPFSVDRNFYYLTGLERAGYILLMTKLGGKLTQQLYIPRPDPHEELYFGHMPTDGEMKDLTHVDKVSYLDKLDWELGRLFSRSYFDFLYMDYHKRELNTVSYPELDLAGRIVSAHPYLQQRNANRMICNMRRVKSPEELECIREAVRITGLGIDSILRHMAPGVNEYQLQAHFEFELKYNGARGNAFYPILGGGENSVNLHYDHNNRPLEDGKVLLVDLGADYKYYSADISRTYPVNGKFTSEQRALYDVVLLGQKAILDALKPGYPIDDTLPLVRETMFPYCKDLGYAKDLKDMETLLPHGVCHYLGLDTHDVGDRTVLEENMPVAIEPGLYLREKGLGVRIEDDAVVTRDGCELLSGQILKDPEELEIFVKNQKGRKETR